MSFQVDYNENDHIIVSHLRGSFDWAVMDHIIPVIAGQIIKNDCPRILIDCRGTFMNLSTDKIYHTPMKLSDSLARLQVDVARLKQAMVIDSKGTEDFHFLETVSVNNHQNTKMFFDEEIARHWLLGK